MSDILKIPPACPLNGASILMPCNGSPRSPMAPAAQRLKSRRARLKPHRLRLRNPTIAVNTDNKKQASVLQLINAHRFRGHQQADLDPLKQYERPEVPELDPAYYNFTEEDLTLNLQHWFPVCAR